MFVACYLPHYYVRYCFPWLFIYPFSGGSSNTLITTDSRDVSPSSVFGATRNTSPVGHSGYLTPRRSHSPNPAAAAAAGRIPIRKNSFVITDSQHNHVLPSVSPRSSSPAIRTGQWSGRVTPSALETCMETSFISTNNPFMSCLSPNTSPDDFLDDYAPGLVWHTNLLNLFRVCSQRLLLLFSLFDS